MAARFLILACIVKREGKRSVNGFPKNWNIGKAARGVKRSGFWEEKSACLLSSLPVNKVQNEQSCIGEGL